MNPSHGKLPDIPMQDAGPRAQMERRKALLQLLEMGQRDIDAGNFRDLAEFLDELDGEDPDQSVPA
ncbi:hypothetical protein [Paraburkholderia sp. BL10I2N1]|uniref:hypothetical protein n=1 Tax=Paraburkholderia sp. BL10I2N1 TaxID=1938796 RepID=UPI00105CE868|nr:hypothetical protein [Paraburkholderia sp. BL10I2N1]